MAKANRFPKTLFVKTETDSGTSYFVADAAEAALVEMGQKQKIAVYQLVEMHEIEGVAKSRKL